MRQLAKKIDLHIIFIILVSSFALYLAHYHYTGIYSTINSFLVEAKTPLNYPYPYFSDEWYAVAFIKDAIITQSLPVRNPIWYGPFTNLEMAFHSLLAEIVLLLSLNPLLGYVPLSIAINVLIIVLIYMFLVISNVKKPLSAIASLCALYIINTSFVPGLWSLIPLTMGIVFLLLSMSFYYLKSRKMFMLASFLTLIFYPPLAPFIFVLMLFQLNNKSVRENLKSAVQFMAIIALSAILVASLFLFDRFAPEQIFQMILGKLLYASYAGDNIVFSFPIYFAIPLPVLLLSFLGIPVVYKKKKALFFMVIVSLAFWICYSFTSYSFIIEFVRLVIVGSVLLVVVAGFGLTYLFEKFEKYTYSKDHWKLVKLQYVILFLFVPLLFLYTKSDAWSHFSGKNEKVLVYNLPLANQFFHPEDLRIFSEIKNQRFFSFPWKGSVISVATNNFPLTIKSGSISGPVQDYLEQFRKYSCKEKLDFVKRHELVYVYIPELTISCPNFSLKDKSEEGILLYKVNLN
ncbi:MAG: hypothetical protein KA035_01115 [Candidatus Levybacteria bacterium]|nr:hypothetical protein [Candidatus Levybacteria bacterium]